jgi:hypothetical protein
MREQCSAEEVEASEELFAQLPGFMPFLFADVVSHDFVEPQS